MTSHWPLQVAAHADHHLCVRKDVAPDGRMLTAVVPLQRDEERVAEVAAMLGLDADAAQVMLRDATASVSTADVRQDSLPHVAQQA